MRKNFLFNLGLLSFEAATLGSQVAPGVFKINGARVGETGAIVVLNHLPNENNDVYGGWNFFFVKTVSSTPTLHTSRKANPLYNALNLGADVSEKIPANYTTAQDAVDAYEASVGITPV